MWRAPYGLLGTADEYVGQRLKQTTDERFRKPRRGCSKPLGFVFSGPSVSAIFALAGATGVALLCFLIFGGF